MQKLIYFGILVLLITSCTVTKVTTTKTMDIYGAGVIQKPVLVDLDVKDTKVTETVSNSTSTSGSNVSNSSTTVSIEDLKNQAVSIALKKANADVMVEPKFEIETSNSVTKVTVNGFPATYKNFRPIKEEDVKLLKVGVTQKANVYEPKTTDSKNKGSFWGVILTIGAIGGIILLLAP